MLDEQNGQMVTVADAANQLGQFGGFCRIHACRRFIQQEQGGLCGERARRLTPLSARMPP